MLRVDRETFIDKLSKVPEKPAEMEEILAVNSGRLLP
jgi:hypothetical protein